MEYDTGRVFLIIEIVLFDALCLSELEIEVVVLFILRYFMKKRNGL